MWPRSTGRSQGVTSGSTTHPPSRCVPLTQAPRLPIPRAGKEGGGTCGGPAGEAAVLWPQGETILQELQRLLGRNVSLAVATSAFSLAPNSTDLQRLAARGGCFPSWAHNSLQCRGLWGQCRGVWSLCNSLGSWGTSNHRRRLQGERRVSTPGSSPENSTVTSPPRTDPLFPQTPTVILPILSLTLPGPSLSAGAQVRQVPMRQLTGGVLHSKFWVVDGRHIYVGSANMDWRALTQVSGNAGPDYAAMWRGAGTMVPTSDRV